MSRGDVPSVELERLKCAAVAVATILDEGERDPTWRESQELEEAAIAYGRAARSQHSAAAGAEPSTTQTELVSPATSIDLPWPSDEQMAEINRRNIAAARIEDGAIDRYAIIEWRDGTRYTDWTSRSHEDLIAAALRNNLANTGETLKLGWVDRARATGEAEYTWLETEYAWPEGLSA